MRIHWTTIRINELKEMMQNNGIVSDEYQAWTYQLSRKALLLFLNL